jgi:hypothetical protein
MTETVRVSRGDMIDHLTQSMLDDLEMNPDYAEKFVRQGFMGYEQYETSDLIDEYKEYVSEEDSNNVNVIVTEGV